MVSTHNFVCLLPRWPVIYVGKVNDLAAHLAPRLAQTIGEDSDRECQEHYIICAEPAHRCEAPSLLGSGPQ